MEEKNELNDIILNRNNSNGSNKKLLLAVATLSLILIIVVVIMNSLQSQSNDNLPQAVLPPEPVTQSTAAPQEDPLFEPVEVIEEKVDEDEKLHQIAQKLKQQSQQTQQTAQAQEEVVIAEPTPLTPPKAEPAPVQNTPKPQTLPAVAKVPEFPKAVATPAGVIKGKHYIQVGSFSKPVPSNTLIKKIEASGFAYMYHKVESGGKSMTKVLIGPYNSDAEARKALGEVRRVIESGAFLTKV
ncbi:MAG: SPOR domain-containing protein [Campylobacterales bacterium]|nr:SPOR domain-containing protein [Campylobacterales bacterium]